MILAAVAAAAKAPVKAPTLPTLPQTVPAAQAAVQAPIPATWFQLHASWATHGVAGLFIIAAISLVVLLAVQTTKQEGLSGTIGGRVESAYSRMGAEEQLKRLTGLTAVVFVVTAFVLSLTGI
ncbi:MAG TPA: preprotein translocase subunit SecG [Candidatus Baltobacteraceae bacterium]|nr:preprotein translocase subunit SecG [Candidatus Baltobacteraceae bacterium]